MPIEPGNAESAPAVEVRRSAHWSLKLLRLFFVIFCFEMGVFLVVFPWMNAWEVNRAATYASWLTDIWGSPAFRGALSGLGLVDIYISFVEMLALIRGHLAPR